MGRTDRPPKWIKPQLTRLVEEAPSGEGWCHEIKLDGYRMHARIDGRDIKLLTRTGLDWSHRYRRTIEALRELKVKSAYLDDGAPVFSRLQAAMDEGRTDQLVFFAFDLLFLNGASTAQLPLIKRKERLQRLCLKGLGDLRGYRVLSDRSDRPDFAARRRRIGASREVMAIGLGLTAAEIQEIEDGRASEATLNHYAQWLDRLEAWPAEKRAQILLDVIDGAKRFPP